MCYYIIFDGSSLIKICIGRFYNSFKIEKTNGDLDLRILLYVYTFIYILLV